MRKFTAADWNKVLAVAKENAERHGVADRYHTIPGNAFESDFGTGYDVILVPNFLHHFDAKTNEDFLRKLNNSLAEGGKIMTVEFCRTKIESRRRHQPCSRWSCLPQHRPVTRIHFRN